MTYSGSEYFMQVTKFDEPLNSSGRAIFKRNRCLYTITHCLLASCLKYRAVQQQTSSGLVSRILPRIRSGYCQMSKYSHMLQASEEHLLPTRYNSQSL